MYDGTDGTVLIMTVTVACLYRHKESSAECKKYNKKRHHVRCYSVVPSAIYIKHLYMSPFAATNTTTICLKMQKSGKFATPFIPQNDLN